MIRSSSLISLTTGLFLGVSSLLTSSSQAGLVEVLASEDWQQVKGYCKRESERETTPLALKALYTQLSSIYDTPEDLISYLGTPELDDLTQAIIEAEERKKRGEELVLRSGQKTKQELELDFELAMALSQADVAGNETAQAGGRFNEDLDLALALSLEELPDGLAKVAQEEADRQLALSLEAENRSDRHSGASASAAGRTARRGEQLSAEDIQKMKRLGELVSPDRLPFGTNVHTLDQLVGNYLPETLRVMDQYNLGNDALSFQQIQEDMVRLLRQQTFTVSSSAAGPQEPITSQTIIDFIPRVFRADFLGLGNDFRRMLSRAWTLALNDFEKGNLDGIIHIGVAIAENYLGGGTDCLQGRRNRMIVAAMRIIEAHAATLEESGARL